MKIYEINEKIDSTENKAVIIENIPHFELAHIFDCGQCFRFDQQLDGSYTGVAFGKVINIQKIDNETFIIYNSNINDFENIWSNFLDIPTDYGKIKNSLNFDVILGQAMKFGYGIRILRQAPWECIISFIFSIQNNIPRIKKIISHFCQLFGKPITYNGNTYYSFPTPADLAGITSDSLAPIKAGYRAKFVVDAVEKVVSGAVDIEKIKGLSTLEAKKELLKIKGVGDKVSDCVLLFGFGRMEAFPKDVWIKRILTSCYDENFSSSAFGEFSGIAQQYLFYWGRENKI